MQKNSTHESLSKELSSLSATKIIECLDIIRDKKENFISQDHSKATYAKKIEKAETKINWNDKAKNILAKINGLYPIPGSWFEIDGSRIKLLEAKEIMAKGKPGEIINDQFSIACSDSAIQVLKLKKEGKNAMNALDFLAGNKLKKGKNINEI